MSLVKWGQTSTRINSASGIQSHTTVGGDATGGLPWGNLGNLGAQGGESCRAAALRDTPNTMACHQGQGWRKGSSPPEHGDCLSASEQLQMCQEVSCRKKSGCCGAQSDLELHSTWPCVYNQEKRNPTQKQRTGAAKKSQPRKMWCIQILV